ncbi:Flp family type IVb pilin [Halodesulfovibrio aestuarii]|uniref:Flp family type IVb pilin n=1 Tax=Halodesulfovibrio aestuarii TaxID=126333 RepID=A0A8G2F7A3_9BACT|nr:Flp family type IVb pilin [Halodesulfovibrio aestuarii]SHI80974.1 pilus assembly protein Flp/PilA [Halodesulfovibrio aestuarii]
MLSAVKRFITEERGASAVEYALLIALIAMAIIGGATLLGTTLDEKYNDVAGQVEEAGAQPGGQ